MNKYWIYFALLGALWYGVFSFSLGIVDPVIKNDKNLQLGYGILVNAIAFPIQISSLLIWQYLYKKSAKNLYKKMRWFPLLLIVLFGIGITPLHTLVVNTGGSLGQETMYTLAIIPVLFFSWLLLNEKLKRRQWFGIFLAGISILLMKYNPSKGKKKDTNQNTNKNTNQNTKNNTQENSILGPNYFLETTNNNSTNNNSTNNNKSIIPPVQVPLHNLLPPNKK